MIYQKKVSPEYLKKHKYYQYRKYGQAMLLLAVVVAGIIVVTVLIPFFNNNANNLTETELQNTLITGSFIILGEILLAILFFIFAKKENKRIKKEDSEKELHDIQKEKEQIENFDPFI